VNALDLWNGIEEWACWRICKCAHPMSPCERNLLDLAAKIDPRLSELEEIAQILAHVRKEGGLG
jgi:hypothetical protein